MTARIEIASADLAAQEASHWLIALQEEPESADLADRFAAWLQADPQHLAAWEETRLVYGLIGTTEPAHATSWDSAEATRPPAPSRRRSYGKLAAGALTAAAIVIGLLTTGSIGNIGADFKTGTGEVRSVDLADGSRVWLGPDTAIDVTMQATSRKIHLRSGEAFFDVAPDPTRPFSAEIGGVTATVLGTAFDLRETSSGVEVSVQHGKVQVAGPDRILAAGLTAGQWLRTDGIATAIEGQRPAGQIGAWRQRQLIAQNLSVGEIVERLRPYFRGVVVLNDQALAEKRLTGVYNLADPQAALTAIAQGQNAVIRQMTPWFVILSAE